VTNRTREMLICVYYRVAAGDSQRVISGVREFQRTLPAGSGVKSASLPDARTASIPSHDPPSDARVESGADATVMETYRLALPAAAGPDADTVVRAFLATLATAARPLAGALRGARHVELFAPCVL
jgi:hypothetical protein